MTRRVGRSVRYAFLIVLGLLWLVPVYLVLVNAAKAPIDYDQTQAWSVPAHFALFANIAQAWTTSNMGESVLPTVIYSTIAPAITVLIGACAGFGIIALRIRAGFFWFSVIFAGIVFPLQMLLMPLFVGFAKIGLFDTRTAMVIVYAAIGIPFATLVMRNYFSGVARSIYEAALMDGASAFQIFRWVYVPVSWSALVTIFLFQALTSLQGAYGGSAPPTVLAGALLVSLPTVVLFLGAQRFYQRGLALSQA